MMRFIFPWALLFLSYFVASFGRLYFPRLAKAPFLVVMGGAWLCEIFLFVFVVALFSGK